MTSIKSLLKKHLLQKKISRFSRAMISIICCTTNCIWIKLAEADQILLKSQAPSVSTGFMSAYEELNFIIFIQLRPSTLNSQAIEVSGEEHCIPGIHLPEISPLTEGKHGVAISPICQIAYTLWRQSRTDDLQASSLCNKRSHNTSSQLKRDLCSLSPVSLPFHICS